MHDLLATMPHANFSNFHFTRECKLIPNTHVLILQFWGGGKGQELWSKIISIFGFCTHNQPGVGLWPKHWSQSRLKTGSGMTHRGHIVCWECNNPSICSKPCYIKAACPLPFTSAKYALALIQTQLITPQSLEGWISCSKNTSSFGKSANPVWCAKINNAQLPDKCTISYHRL